MKEDLFRKNAIEHLSNPDDLHSAIQLTRAYDWVGIGVLIALTLFLLVWSILTKVPVTVAGQGIILDNTGVLEKVVTTSTSGRITRLMIHPGAKIKKGQIIAEIDQSALINQLKSSKEKLLDLKKQLTRLEQLNKRERVAYEYYEIQQRDELENYIASLSQRLSVLDELEQGTRVIREKQLASNKELFDIIIQISETENYLSQSKSQLHSLALNKESNFNNKEKEVLRVSYEINNTQREINLLKHSISTSKYVKSAYSGIVSEIKIDKGEIVESGSPIVSLMAEEFSEFYKDSHKGVF